MLVLAKLINLIFLVYTIMIIVRILGSWFPEAQGNSFMRFIGQMTDPYLNLFRKIIPPLGMIDLSPLAALLVLQGAKWLIFYVMMRLL